MHRHKAFPQGALKPSLLPQPLSRSGGDLADLSKQLAVVKPEMLALVDIRFGDVRGSRTDQSITGSRITTVG